MTKKVFPWFTKKYICIYQSFHPCFCFKQKTQRKKDIVSIYNQLKGGREQNKGTRGQSKGTRGQSKDRRGQSKSNRDQQKEDRDRNHLKELSNEIVTTNNYKDEAFQVFV